MNFTLATRHFAFTLLLIILSASTSNSATTASVVAEETLPEVYFQIGDPRTATTLQFAIVCAANAVRFMDVPNGTVVCGFGQKYTKKLKNSFDHPHVTVIKDHKLLSVEKSVLKHAHLGGKAWVFETTRNHTHGHAAQQMRKYDIPSKVVVDTEDVKKYGFNAGRSEYEAAFQLNSTQSTILYEWVKLWDILRMCCGSQMSQAWREVLVGDVPVRESQASFGASPNAAISVCSSHNISQVEEELLNTELYRAMHDRAPMLGRASNVDGQFTGSYCERCQRLVTRFKLGFSEPCDKNWSYYISHEKRRNTSGTV